MSKGEAGKTERNERHRSKERIAKRARSIPPASGVYLMKDDSGTVIYVGKAVDLKKRVASYFRRRPTLSKTDFLVDKIADIDTVVTGSEAEALILEASLIKRYQPYYNISLRDDKTYPYIEITGDPFPRVAIVRPRALNPASTYYGPYTSVSLIREALEIIRRIFPFRTCDPFPDKECLFFHIGLCAAPCIGRQTRQDYGKTIRHIRIILDGKKDRLFKQLTAEMERCARRREFERAAKIRDQLRAIGALYSGTGDINYFKEAEQLQRALNLPVLPKRIETFDISNIMGQQSVGSMVSFFNGRPDKHQYRRFKIKTVEGSDDPRMMAEVIGRRYSRLKQEHRLMPDLIVIDGGKGQLSSAQTKIRELDLDIPMISLAKREEEVFVPGRRSAIVLPRNSLGLKLLQRCRDEAHRFAVSYHRMLRNKKTFN